MFHLGILAALAAAPADQRVAHPLPRIGIHDGRFVEGRSRTPWHPRGFNYIRVRSAPGYLWHDTFNPATYDGERADAALADLASHGFTVTRVFVDHTRDLGCGAPKGTQGLSPAFMANVCDFLARATAHRIRVIFAMLYLPENERYQAMVEQGPRLVNGENSPWFNEGMMRARAAYMADFVAAIRSRDPGLLGAALSFETENEANLIATAEPFSRHDGQFRYRGKGYDLASDAARQQLADDAVVAATNLCVEAVRKVDRQALVAVDVFTFRAVGRTGPGHTLTDKSPDPRMPARPMAIAHSKAAYLDVHFYPENDSTLDADFRSIEMPQLQAECKRVGKPMIVGEIGAFKPNWKTIDAAVNCMQSSITRLLASGFDGFLYWTYDTAEQGDILWHGKDAGSAILDALSKVRKQ